MHRHLGMLRLVILSRWLPAHLLGLVLRLVLRLGRGCRMLNSPPAERPRHGVEQTRPSRFGRSMHRWLGGYSCRALRIGEKIGPRGRLHDRLRLSLQLPRLNRLLLEHGLL